MHYTHSFHTVSRTTIQVAILAAVAAVGIAFGRWAIPAGHSSSAATIARLETRPSELSRAAAERKLIQMDQAHDRRAGEGLAPAAPSAQSNITPASLSAAERKLIQMEAADDRRAALAVAASSSSTPLSAAERKLIQMDAADDRRAATAVAGITSGPLSAAERKLIQMDARDAR